MIPKAILECGVTLSRQGYEVAIQCDNLEDANEIVDWLANLPDNHRKIAEIIRVKLDKLDKKEATGKVLQEILAERIRQDQKWGQQDHPPADFLMILGEEVGEANKAALEHKFANKPLDEYRKELVQVAAVAVAMIESYDRSKQ